MHKSETSAIVDSRLAAWQPVALGWVRALHTEFIEGDFAESVVLHNNLSLALQAPLASNWPGLEGFTAKLQSCGRLRRGGRGNVDDFEHIMRRFLLTTEEANSWPYFDLTASATPALP